MNKWQAIDDFWHMWGKAIHEAGSDEWGAQPVDFAWIELTPIEQWLLEDMRNLNMVVYPQWPVGGFFVDFANPVAKVAIECDGKEFHTDWKKDAERDDALTALGWTVYRFTGRMCFMECDEETGELSDGQKLLRDICAAHQIQRKRRPGRVWSSFGQGATA
jgi:very-short-patch-repair endonuclease